MSAGERFTVQLELQKDYRFAMSFGSDAIPDLTVDELPPLGGGAGPNPVRLLAGAVGHCLGASLLYCLKRSHIDVPNLHVGVEGTLVRNERGRLRVGSIEVTLAPEVAEQDRGRMSRCLELFEDFCMVTESVRHGIPVTVAVAPASVPQTVNA